MRFALSALVFTALALLWITPPAQAGKGVKKNTGGERVVHGVVASVETDKKGGHGSFVLKSHPGKKKKSSTAQAGKAQAGQEHQIHVGKHTKFESASGSKEHQVGFSHLKAGEHVTVHLKGDIAEKVVIHHKSKGNKKA